MAIVKKIGKYPVLGQIGEGGMSSVYKAKHPNLDRFIIIKKLKHISGAQAVERFQREARIMMDLRNENIVQVHDYFKEGSSFYIVMEFVDGMSLEELLEKKRHISNEMAMLIFMEVCKALKYAHDKGIVHRDIKPGNIMISKKGEIKLTDFGIATSEEDADEGLTIDGMTLGTPAYMSPEQLSSTKDVDKRADIYSMGVMLYEMTCAQKPFPGSFTPETITAIQNGIYKAPKKVNPRISPLANRIIKKAMNKKATKRYKDLGYVIAHLSSKLKKYRDQAFANTSVRQYVYEEKPAADGEKAAAPEKQDSYTSNTGKILAITAICIVVLGIAAFIGFTQGYHYELFQADEVGALQVAVKVNKYRLIKKPDQLYMKTVLYNTDGRKAKKINDARFDFTLTKPKDKKKKSKWFYTMASQKIYLPAGNYTLYIHVENENYQKSFYLEPRIIQKTRKNSVEAETVSFTLRSGFRQPLYLYHKVTDAASGRNITAATDMSVYFYGWKKWKDFVKMKNYRKIFTSGKWYTFRFHRKKYYYKNHRVYVEPYQNVLNLDISLPPIPGKVYIQSNYKGLDVLIDNSKYYFPGGFKKKYAVLKKTIKKKWQVLYLAPGEYFFLVKRSKAISSAKRVRVESSKAVRLKIDYNDDKESLKLEVKK